MIDDRLTQAEIVKPDKEPDIPKVCEREWTTLMARSQDGETSAYFRLLQEITPYIRYRTSELLRVPSDVEDVVQDILLTLHAVRQTYDPARPFGSWLVAIVNRRVFDRLRQLERHPAHRVPLTGKPETIGPQFDDPGRRTSTDRPSQGSSVLPRIQQQAIRLLKLRNMSTDDAALAAESSVASFKTTMLRAFQSLRLKPDERGGSR